MNTAQPLRRVDATLLRDQMRANLTEAEQREFGVNLPTGAAHPRAFVGPPYIYDLMGALQFQLLVDLGFREYHRFLDVGCGSLRLGRLAIMYQLPGRYFGVEPDRGVLDQGCRMHFGAGLRRNQVLRQKKPKFTHNSDFDFSFTQGPVDFVVAQSIASHAGCDLLRRMLGAIAAVSHDETIAMVTYVRCIDPAKSNTRDGWFYPDCITYTDQAFGEMARAAGLNAYRSVWPTANMQHGGLITTQQPTILTRKPWSAPLPQTLAGDLLGGIVAIN